jgi:hypothetical protein
MTDTESLALYLAAEDVMKIVGWPEWEDSVARADGSFGLATLQMSVTASGRPIRIVLRSGDECGRTIMGKREALCLLRDWIDAWLLEHDIQIYRYQGQWSASGPDGYLCNTTGPMHSKGHWEWNMRYHDRFNSKDECRLAAVRACAEKDKAKS